ncbi:hypothetical protein WMF38_57735 [Sorangium sp. So ce118]
MVGDGEDPERDVRRARIRAWLANLPPPLAKLYEDLKRLDPKGQPREK